MDLNNRNHKLGHNMTRLASLRLVDLNFNCLATLLTYKSLASLRLVDLNLLVGVAYAGITV